MVRYQSAGPNRLSGGTLMGLNVPFSRSEGLPSIHKAAKQGSEKIGLVINAMQHGVIYVGTGVLPAVSHPESMSSTLGPGPEVQNRLGSFVGAMSASFQVQPPDAPPARRYCDRGSVWRTRSRDHFAFGKINPDPSLLLRKIEAANRWVGHRIALILRRVYPAVIFRSISKAY
jgi:hypothetical protein